MAGKSGGGKSGAGSKSSTVKVNRSAISGKFVKESTVKRHPGQTVTEHYKKD